MKNLNFQKGGIIASLFLVLGGIVIWQKVQGSMIKTIDFNHGTLPNNDNYYKRIAEQQFLAMKGTGTKKTILLGDMEKLNGEELKAVYNAFGKRNYHLFGHDGFLTEWGLFGSKIDLFSWYKKELGGSTLDKMRQIWSIKNIQITF